MEVIHSDDKLREEILNDARKKADRILKKSQKESELITGSIAKETKKFSEEYCELARNEIETRKKIIRIFIILASQFNY